MYYIGIDIGGTKCAVCLGDIVGDTIQIIRKIKFPTAEKEPYAILDEFLQKLKQILVEEGLQTTQIVGIGISCGGPLNAKQGVILTPPNLPKWDKIPVVAYFEKGTGIKTYLQNDANACALAEWKFGAGKGTTNLIFLTFGTGLGAGFILNGKLYAGTSDMAGEVGHIRLTQDGPCGYGKNGSWEGYCSGGGIAQLGVKAVAKALEQGKNPLLWERAKQDWKQITAKLIGDLADEGDSLSLSIYQMSGQKLGVGLSYLIDILNPERIVIGGIFTKSGAMLWQFAKKVVEQETLSYSRTVCTVVPAELGDQVGDFAALSVALGE